MVISPAAVELNIEELILEGFPGAASFSEPQRQLFAEAFQAELAGLLVENGIPPSVAALTAGKMPSPMIHLPGTVVTLPQPRHSGGQASPAELGRQTAQGLYRSFSEPEEVVGGER